MGRGGKRRRSAFAEEEEGYMFVEEGFRMRFNNGEVIDFYADTPEDKEGWMKVLSEIVGRGDSGLDTRATMRGGASGARLCSRERPACGGRPRGSAFTRGRRACTAETGFFFFPTPAHF